MSSAVAQVSPRVPRRHLVGHCKVHYMCVLCRPGSKHPWCRAQRVCPFLSRTDALRVTTSQLAVVGTPLAGWPRQRCLSQVCAAKGLRPVGAGGSRSFYRASAPRHAGATDPRLETRCRSPTLWLGAALRRRVNQFADFLHKPQGAGPRPRTSADADVSGHTVARRGLAVRTSGACLPPF